jgi:hypothetical protein
MSDLKAYSLFISLQVSLTDEKLGIKNKIKWPQQAEQEQK